MTYVRVKQLRTFAILTILITSFQNCAPSFQVNQAATDANSGSGSSASSTTTTLPSTTSTTLPVTTTTQAGAACALPASLGGGSIGHNQTINAYRDASVAAGQTCQSQVRVCNNGNLSGSYTYPACTVASNPPVVGNGLQLDLSYVNQSSATYTRFRNMVDAVVNGGGRPYVFSALDPAYMFRITGQAKYCTLAVQIAEEQVTAAEAAIAGGGRPAISGDSYLDVGPMLSEVGVAYAWCAAQMTSAQRTRWANYANQALYNVWNHNSATWGGRSATWSGWSVDNPANNYYYSFVTATMYWSLASGNNTYLNLLVNDKLPALTQLYSTVSGGGSREGTGYGTSHMGLFHLYKVWKDSTGQDIANASTHMTDSIRYWVHATVPTRERFAPIGDQARDSSASLYDYHRRLVLEAMELSTNQNDKNLASWWLNHISISQMTGAFNFRHDLYPAGSSGALPSEPLIHHATGTGHLFARTSWNTDATWVSFIAGPFTESHAAQDQGSIEIYKNQWLAVRPNILGHSGIVQDVNYQNNLRFEQNGSIVRQTLEDSLYPTRPSVMTLTSRNNSTGEFTAEADLKNAYYGKSAVTSWNRKVGFVNEGGARVINVQDLFQVSSGTQAVFQLHTIAQPAISGNTVSAGGLVMTVLAPANPQIRIVSVPTENSDFSGGYRIEIRGGTSEYRVQIRTP